MRHSEARVEIYRLLSETKWNGGPSPSCGKKFGFRIFYFIFLWMWSSDTIVGDILEKGQPKSHVKCHES